jgi:hypothetical protein
MEGFHAPLGRRRLIEEMLKDLPGDPHDAFVLADDDAELDTILVIVPGHIFGKCEKHSGSPGKEAMMFPYCSIMPEYAEQQLRSMGWPCNESALPAGSSCSLASTAFGTRCASRASGLSSTPDECWDERSSEKSSRGQLAFE